MELLLTLCIVSILSAIAIPSYRGIHERMRVSTAIQDLATIAGQIERYRSIHLMLPSSLAQVTGKPAADPWGNPYRYLNFIGASNGQIRKDHNLHPLNTEYDLYSMGPNGASVAPLTAAPSRDDIIWANDGSFVGKAEDF